MSRHLIACLLAVAGCGPETTSFRTTDKGDATAPPGAAVYSLDAPAVAEVQVWSHGGYIGTGDEPMTHLGFSIRNFGVHPITFDGDALELVILGKGGAPLPATRFTTVTPLGPAVVPIAAGSTVPLDAYFMLGVRPRVVERMRIRWSMTVGDRVVTETTEFVRDDDFPVLDPPAWESETPR